ncbi:MAG: amidohydrolase family protein [Proteobacteria bacterium]|nr:amidohydrolase family protein [Pseudomonadota bacterium]HQR04507.1 amidohydrolase family protein [Rhodocyclaceae bacterium]
MVDVIKLGIRRSARNKPLLPDPAPREVKYTLISVDDHLMEPPHTFEGRLPARFRDRTPRVVETEEGHQVWAIDGQPYFQVGFMCVAGRPREDQRLEPARFDEIRAGCYDVDARIRDMDIGGVYASVHFPSGVTGFGGHLFSKFDDPEFGLACVRAWNDWLHEEWYGKHPDRIIPLGITYLTDAKAGAEEIYRNARRGFKAVTIPEQPHRIGLPSVFSPHWEPIVRACAETGTVLNLHVGSAGFADMPAGAPILELGATLFGPMAISSAAEWLWSGYPARYPELKIAMSEGGIGWPAMLMDRLDNIMARSGYGSGWPDPHNSPTEVLKRNFWFAMIDDASTICTRYRIGVENILCESDYPHGDGTWPDTQQVLEKVLGALPAEEIRLITHGNAARLYNHPLPAIVRP